MASSLVISGNSLNVLRLYKTRKSDDMNGQAHVFDKCYNTLYREDLLYL